MSQRWTHGAALAIGLFAAVIGVALVAELRLSIAALEEACR